MIKVTTLEYTRRFGNTVRTLTKKFYKYIAENGNELCVINNDRIVSKDDGNQEFINDRNVSVEYTVTHEQIDADDNTIFKMLAEKLDLNAPFIDDYRRQKEITIRNQKIQTILETFEKTAETKFNIFRYFFYAKNEGDK